jgi:hypothetical protein
MIKLYQLIEYQRMTSAKAVQAPYDAVLNLLQVIGSWAKRTIRPTGSCSWEIVLSEVSVPANTTHRNDWNFLSAGFGRRGTRRFLGNVLNYESLPAEKTHYFGPKTNNASARN